MLVGLCHKTGHEGSDSRLVRRKFGERVPEMGEQVVPRCARDVRGEMSLGEALQVVAAERVGGQAEGEEGLLRGQRHRARRGGGRGRGARRVHVGRGYVEPVRDDADQVVSRGTSYGARCDQRARLLERSVPTRRGPQIRIGKYPPNLKLEH